MSVFNGTKCIFMTRRSYYTPQAQWRFYVRFYNEFAPVDDALLQLFSEEIISIDLPKYTDAVGTRKFIDTRKSYIISRNTTGTCNIKFNMRVADNPLYDILSMKLLDYNYDKSNKIVDRSYFDKHRMFNRVEITMLPNAGYMGNQKQLTLQNVLVTDISFDQLSYESNAKVTGTLALHYDAWYWSNIDHLYTGYTPGGDVYNARL